MCPIKYHRKIQEEDTEVATSNTYGSESESTKMISKE
jgi:hypothetical protein